MSYAVDNEIEKLRLKYHQLCVQVDELQPCIGDDERLIHKLVSICAMRASCMAKIAQLVNLQR